MTIRREMEIRAAVAPGLAVKIPVFDVHAHGQAHVGAGGQLFSAREFFRRPAELEDGRVFACNHFRAQFNFHRAAVAGVRHKIPDGGRPAWNAARFLKSSGERKPSAFTQARRRFTKTWRSTGTAGSRFAPSAQSYLEFTRPRSTQSRAMPPMPLVKSTKVEG